MTKTGAQLVDELIEMASEDKEPVSVLLRKCLVLAALTKNENLRTWADRELNGYAAQDAVPPYRKINVESKGYFRGPMGSAINNQPLPLGVLKEADRSRMSVHELREPIAAYDHVVSAKGHPRVNWPADLIAHYQGSFIEGFALADAWQDVPMGTLVGLMDSVRNRILNFALEIRGSLSDAAPDVEKLPAELVNKSVVNNIFGGVNLFGGSGHAITQVGSIQVRAGDIGSLVQVLGELGLSVERIGDLRTLIEQEGAAKGSGTLPAKVLAWFSQAVASIGKEGLKVTAEVATRTLLDSLMRYYGVTP